jgi:hypothetical protein
MSWPTRGRHRFELRVDPAEERRREADKRLDDLRQRRFETGVAIAIFVALCLLWLPVVHWIAGVIDDIRHPTCCHGSENEWRALQ